MADSQPTRIRVSREMRDSLLSYCQLAATEAESLTIALDVLSRQPGAAAIVQRLQKIAGSIALSLSDLRVELDDQLASEAAAFVPPSEGTAVPQPFLSVPRGGHVS